MEILSTVISEVAKCLYEPLKRHGGYLFCYSRKVDKLSEDAKNLCIKRDDVDRKLEEASRSQREPLQVVKDWKEKVENVAGQADSLREKLDGEQRLIHQSGCCWCPNFISSRYKLGKDAAREINRVKKLSDDHLSFSTELTYCPPPPAASFIRTDTIQTNESITSIEKQIKQALADHNIRSIGIHGMGGIGKTTLVTKINNDMENSNDLFDKVIMVTVSQNPDFKVIQGDIAERLGLHIKDVNTVDNRANLLVKELKKYERILIILDDVWQKLEMVHVGIPHRNEHSCCKIIITTRNRDICDRMRMDRKIAVQPWSVENSRKLFESKVGLDVVSKYPTLGPLANEIVKECGGSPLAIVTLASALVGNQNDVLWKEALRCLKSSDPIELENIEGMNMVISSIRFSYNNLTCEGMKLCFLFCSLFPEDYEIDLFDLRTYGIGEGFLRCNGSLLEARGKLESYIERLKARNLILDCRGKYMVKMHDVVRDVARLIASKEYEFIEKAGLGISEWPELNNAKGYKHMSLMENDICVLPNTSNMPELHTLLLQKNSYLYEIPDTFFEGMSVLVNLDISLIALTRLPSSMSCLTNLRTLQFSNYNGDFEMDVSLIGKLKNLEILILANQRLKNIKELAALTKLKVLHLDQRFESIPAGVLSKLVYLEELHLKVVPNNFSLRLGDEEVDTCARFDEVASLKCLTTLRLAETSGGTIARDIPMFWNDNNLQEFDIRFGDISFRMRGDGYSKYLFCDDLSSPIQNWILFLLQKTEVFHVRKSKDFSHIPQFDVMNSLKFLRVQEWVVMKHVVNIEVAPQTINTLGRLKWLHLVGLANLEKICQGQVQDGFVMDLTSLEISKCDKILTFLPFNILKTLQSLIFLYIEDCISLTHVISTIDAGISMPDRALDHVSSLKLHGLPNLISFCNGPLPTRFLKNLKLLSIENCGMLTNNIFSHELVQSLDHLEEITLKNFDGAEVLFDLLSSNMVPSNALGSLRVLCLGGILKMKQLFNNKQGAIERDGMLTRLKILTLEDLPNFVTICAQPAFGENFRVLEKLCVRGCGKLQSFEKTFVSNDRMIVVNELGPSAAIFQNLTQVEVSRCHNLKNLFTWRMAQNSLQNLHKIDVHDCNKLKWIIGNEGEGKKGSIPSIENMLCHLRDLQFQDLPELLSFSDIDGINNNFALPQFLTNLSIDRCPKLYFKQHSSPSPTLVTSILQQQQQEEDKGVVLFENKRLLKLLSSYSSLQSLRIMGLDQVQQVFGFKEETITITFFYKLEYLYIHNLSKLESIVVGNIPLDTFANLQTLCISECHSLKGYLLSSTLARCLQHLKTLKIISCMELENLLLLSNEDEDSMDQRMVLPILPRLQVLTLIFLPKLESIVVGSHIPLEIIGNLQSLNISRCHSLRGYLLFPFLARQFQHLQGLKINSCKELENLFLLSNEDEDSNYSYSIDQKIIPVPPRLQVLILKNLSKFENICPRGRVPLGIFGSLQFLEVTGCNTLTGCLLSPILARSLKFLEELRVLHCHNLENILMVSDKDEDSYSNLVDEKKKVPLLPRLKTLQLSYLPKLTSLCGDWDANSIQWPSLAMIHIYECSKLRHFPMGPDNTPKLKNIF